MTCDRYTDAHGTRTSQSMYVSGCSSEVEKIGAFLLLHPAYYGVLWILYGGTCTFGLSWFIKVLPTTLLLRSSPPTPSPAVPFSPQNLLLLLHYTISLFLPRRLSFLSNPSIHPANFSQSHVTHSKLYEELLSFNHFIISSFQYFNMSSVCTIAVVYPGPIVRNGFTARPKNGTRDFSRRRGMNKSTQAGLDMG